MKHQFRINMKLDFWTIGLALILSIIGILFIYSSSIHAKHNVNYIKQIINLSLCLIIYMVVININYQKYTSQAILVYSLGALFLIATLIFAKPLAHSNTRSWIRLGFFSIQLSEFSKLSFIIAFAVFLNNYQKYVKSFIFILISFVLLGLYLLFILLQPDMGTGLIFVFIFFIMLFVGGGNGIFLGMIIGVAFLSVMIPFLAYYLVKIESISNFITNIIDSKPYLILTGLIFLSLSGMVYGIYKFFRLSKKILYGTLVLLILGFGFFGSYGMKFLLQDYHYKRILVFLDSDKYKKGKGYNIRQSKISIGSGKFTGQGWTKGRQNRSNTVPERDTDFIISTIGEEWGFLGIITVLLLYLFLIYRCLYIAYSARDFVGSLIALGISSMMVSHIMINIFSATGFFPVIGVPLPFISYGGSSLMTNYIGLAVLFNIKMRRFSYN